MAPRKPKKTPLDDVVASAIKAQRQTHGWTQDQLAKRMTDLGFKWGRTTVTEVEGSGRRREVSVAELLGLARVFGVGLDALVWDDSARLEVAPGGLTLDDVSDLWRLLIDTETIVGLVAKSGDEVLIAMVTKEYTRLYALVIERVQFAAEEMRKTAGYLETEFVADFIDRGSQRETS